jgi:hypothetical protein
VSDESRAPTRERIRAQAIATGCGVAAALFAGFTWYTVVTAIRSQATYLCIIVAVAIGFAAVRGAGRGGADIAVITVLVVVCALAVCFYYVDRYGLIRTAENNRVVLDIPLNPSVGWAKLVLREGFKRTPSQYLYCTIALASSSMYAYRGGGR